MGNDGGVIAVKRKFMRHGQHKQRDEQADQRTLRAKRTTMCALTDEPLAAPIVADKLGNLFNKASLIERLLERTLPPELSYIRSMKDIVNCKFYADETSGLRHCPITLQVFNGKHPFVVQKKCGCVLSEKALKEVKSTECLMCGAPAREKDRLALLLPEEKAIEVMLTLHKKDDGKTTAIPALKRKRDEPAAIATNAPKSKVRAVSEALDAVQAEKEKSAVFASLFSGEKSSQKSANDLLMTVGGMRYTLS
ncbi:hypothetical protein SPRG_09760 [Saprolegnia parasitica CBS 223.65]|uniref:Uncharacterized protein n=1 Tax=Saprolegnia parasitica (strain CBS 223.65) TaxID=695850 RepID=A0A067CEP5_SAPPC|nr:hypothetical protein SPRG_09760 [Saprolegnia parasitica CBS 223.65]KDO25031.1 hypothetical protein SPRG_09760 [Saprolegnia parasitica CBS 223.65]|eukprot:XP_012204299.1 hypothetical protein SPRG_09760 [Saprolegnia parasitica CBS 223.65]